MTYVPNTRMSVVPRPNGRCDSTVKKKAGPDTVGRGDKPPATGGATIPTRRRTRHPLAAIHMGSCGANQRRPPQTCGGVAGRATRSRARLSNLLCVVLRVRSAGKERGRRTPWRTGNVRRGGQRHPARAGRGRAMRWQRLAGHGGGAAWPTSTPSPPRTRPSDREDQAVKGEFPVPCSGRPGVVSSPAAET